MASRIKDITTTSTGTPASDEYLPTDSATNGSKKLQVNRIAMTDVAANFTAGLQAGGATVATIGKSAALAVVFG